MTLIAPKFYPHPAETSDIHSEYHEKVQKWVSLQDTSKTKPDLPVLFIFDPNTLPKDSFLLLGLSAGVAENIINFRNKVGLFKQAEDLKKIYTLSEQDYLRLEPYIQIEKSVDKAPGKYSPPVKKKAIPKISIDINQSDEQDWQRLKGIGPAYSARIVKFRNALGGFYAVEQVAQTYGLPDSTFNKIKPFLKVSPILQSIAINQADAATLSRHPYLNWKHANAIINYRKQHGAYRSIDDLKKIKILPEEVIEQVRPYLMYE
jgi:competence protein ComEA